MVVYLFIASVSIFLRNNKCLSTTYYILREFVKDKFRDQIMWNFELGQQEVSVSVDENSVIFFVKVLDDLRKVSIFIPMRHEAAFEFKNHSFRRWPLNICP